MLHRNCIPQAVYDRKCAEYDALLEKYHALRSAGAVLPVEPKRGRVVEAGPSPEAIAARRLHDQMIEDIAKDIENMGGVDPKLAKAEADRIRQAAIGQGIP